MQNAVDLIKHCTLMMLFLTGQVFLSILLSKALKAPVLHNRLHKHTHESRARIRTLSFNVLNWIGQFWSKLDTLASRLIPHFTVTDALRRFDQILHTQCEA